MKIKMKIKLKSKHFIFHSAPEDISQAEMRYIATIFEKQENRSERIPAFLELSAAS